MLGWLRRDRNRRIFRYSDGSRTRWADPIALYRRLAVACGVEPAELLRVIAADPPPGTTGAMLEAFRKRQDEAAAKFTVAVREAFEVRAFSDATGSPRGLTEPELIALAGGFLKYLGGLAESARPFGSSPRPTRPPPPG